MAALTLLAVPLASAPMAHAADNAKGTCFVTDPGGSKTRACTAQDKKDIKKYSGKAFNASKCYSITSSTSNTHVAVADCSGKGTAGTEMCPDPDTGKDVACVSCPDGSSVASETQCSDNAGDAAANDKDCGTATNCDLVTKYINPFVNFLAALVGVAVTISIVVGGIRYASSAGDPQATAAAKARIRNAIIALVTFIFLYALLNFLIPGGLV